MFYTISPKTWQILLYFYFGTLNFFFVYFFFFFSDCVTAATAAAASDAIVVGRCLLCKLEPCHPMLIRFRRHSEGFTLYLLQSHNLIMTWRAYGWRHRQQPAHIGRDIMLGLKLKKRFNGNFMKAIHTHIHSGICMPSWRCRHPNGKKTKKKKTWNAMSDASWKFSQAIIASSSPSHQMVQQDFWVEIKSSRKGFFMIVKW